MKKPNQHHSDEAWQILGHEMKRLSVFVDFVAQLQWTTEQQRKTANRIKGFLQNFEQTHSQWQWNVSLDIFDYEVQGRNGEGNYWRRWSVFFENGRLEIEASTFHSDDDRYPNKDHFIFEGFAVPGSEMSLESLGDLNQFIRDARNYETYITKSLKDIEVDIQIWERK